MTASQNIAMGTKAQVNQPGAVRATTVSQMLGTHYLGKKGLLGLPLVAGLVTALFSVYGMLAFSAGPGALARVIEIAGTSKSVIGFGLMALMFVTVRRSATLILGLGISRWAYWNGICRLALVSAMKITLVLAVLIAVEAATFGWGLLWGIYSTPFVPALSVAYTWKMNAFMLGVSVGLWFLLAFFAQLVGALLGVLSHWLMKLRWGVFYLLGAAMLLAVIWLQPGLSLDLGYSYYSDIVPIEYDKNGLPIYLSHSLYPNGVVPPLVSTFYPAAYIWTVVDYVPAVLLTYGAGWLLLQRVSLR